MRAVQAELAESTRIRGQQEAEIARLLPHKEAFDLLPAFLRRVLLKLARDARR